MNSSYGKFLYIIMEKVEYNYSTFNVHSRTFIVVSEKGKHIKIYEVEGWTGGIFIAYRTRLNTSINWAVASNSSISTSISFIRSRWYIGVRAEFVYPVLNLWIYCSSGRVAVKLEFLGESKYGGSTFSVIGEVQKWNNEET